MSNYFCLGTYAVVDPANTIAEFDEGDNSTFTTIKVLSLPDLVVTGGGIQFSPAFPKEGDPVVVTATVTNSGGQDAADVRVRMFDGDPSTGGTQIGDDQMIIELAASGQASAQVVFDGASSGTQVIFVQVDPLNDIIEQNDSNNTASRTLGVQNASLWFSYVYFSPNGDDIQDTTELFFRLDGSGGAQTVAVYNHRIST